MSIILMYEENSVLICIIVIKRLLNSTFNVYGYELHQSSY